MKSNGIEISGERFSWIEESKQAAEHPRQFDENVRILLRLRKCMTERGWSQKDLAIALGVSPQYVNKLLRNQDPTFSIRTAIDYGEKLHYQLIKVCSDLDDDQTSFCCHSIDIGDSCLREICTVACASSDVSYVRRPLAIKKRNPKLSNNHPSYA